MLLELVDGAADEGHCDGVGCVGVEVCVERGFDAGECELSDAEGAFEWVAVDAFDEGAPSDDGSALWAAQELVGAEGHDVGAVGDGLSDDGFVGERVALGGEEQAGACVVDEWDAGASGELGEGCDVDVAGEADEAEVAGVCFEYGGGVVGERGFVVGDACVVGGADVGHGGAAAGDDVGEAE